VGEELVSKNLQVAVLTETGGGHQFQFVEEVERGVCEWLPALKPSLYCDGVCKGGWYWIKASMFLGGSRCKNLQSPAE